MGAAVSVGRRLRAARSPLRAAHHLQRAFVRTALTLFALLAAWPAGAADRYALIVAGATGGPPYAEQYTAWTQALHDTLVEGMAFDPSKIILLTETSDPAGSSTAENVRRALATLSRRLEPGDLLFTVLIGHGTFDGIDAKFNLVGPDLSAADWALSLRPIRARLVFVNTTSASFPFLESLAGGNRIVVSATESTAQRFDTIFPEHFMAALADPASDIDKNGRTSIWEAFSAASAGVRRSYQQRGELATERGLLDDTGDGIGREAAGQGPDGALASRTYLAPPVPDAPPTDDLLVDLLQRRASLLAEAEELQLRKALMPAGEYAREFERIMIALAHATRGIRERRGT